MSEVHEWSTTAANNNSDPPDGFPESSDGVVMQFSEVNDSMREVMAAVSRLRNDLNGTLVSETDANQSPRWALTSNRTISAYEDGLTFVFTTHMAWDGSQYINLNGLGSVGIQEENGSASLSAIGSGQLVQVRYTVNHLGGSTVWVIKRL